MARKNKYREMDRNFDFSFDVALPSVLLEQRELELVDVGVGEVHDGNDGLADEVVDEETRAPNFDANYRRFLLGSLNRIQIQKMNKKKKKGYPRSE